MKKILLFIVLLIVVAIVGAAAYGFLADDKFDLRHEFVIDAAPGQVFKIVSDPDRVKEWMPVHSKDEQVKEVRRPSASEKLARVFEQAAEGGVKGVNPADLTRHTYVHENGAETTVVVSDLKPGKRYEETVISDTTGMAKMFPEMHWGFEVAEAEGGKTRLTPFMYGTAARPVGVIMNKLMASSGEGKRYQEQMAKNVETLAKGGKVSQ